MREYRVVFSDEASRDLIGIYSYVKAVSSEWDARVVIDRIADKIRTFDLFPERAEPFAHDKHGFPLRVTVEGEYRIIYVVKRRSREVLIARIINTNRDLKQFFEE